MLGNTLFLLKLIYKHMKLVMKKKYIQIRREATAGQVLDMMKVINLQLFNDPLHQSIEESKNSPASSELVAPGSTDSKEQKSLLKVAPPRPGTELLSLSDINKYQIQPKRTAYGGLQCTFIKSDQQLSFDHISSIMELEQSKQLTPLHVTDLSLLDLHKEFQGYTFDNALQDHIRRFLSRSPDSMSMSQMSPEHQRFFEASVLASPDKFSIDVKEEGEQNPIFVRDQQTYLQIQQQQSQKRKRSIAQKKSLPTYPNPKLQIVPEQTVEESRFMSPTAAQEALFRGNRDGRDIWAVKVFKPAYSGLEAVTKLKIEQEKMAAQKQPHAAPTLSTKDSSEKKPGLTGTPFESERKMINFQSVGKSGVGGGHTLGAAVNNVTNPTVVQSQQPIVKAAAGLNSHQNQHLDPQMQKLKFSLNFMEDQRNFMKDSNNDVDVSQQLRKLEKKASLPPEPSSSLLQPGQQEAMNRAQTNRFNINQQEFFSAEDQQSMQSFAIPAPPNRQRENSFSDMLMRSDGQSLASRHGSMKSLNKLTKKQKEVMSSSYDCMSLAEQHAGMKRQREASFSQMDQSESSHLLHLMQMHRSRDLNRDSIKSLRKLTQKQKQLQSNNHIFDNKADSNKLNIPQPIGMHRKREPSFSGIMNNSIDSIISSKMTAPHKPPKIAMQMCDEDSEESGRVQGAFVPPNRRKEMSQSRYDGASSMSSASAHSIMSAQHRNSFKSPAGSVQNFPAEQSFGEPIVAKPDNHRVNMTLPHYSKTSKPQQVIGEKPQEEEETVERGKEETRKEKSLQSIIKRRASDSPERHEHESNHRREEEQNHSKLIKDSLTNESTYSNQI